MTHRYPLMILLTLLAVGGCLYVGLMQYKQYTLPFDISVVDAHTAIIQPIARTPLPPGLQANDRVNLSALTPSARAAIGAVSFQEGSLKAGRSYDFVISRGNSSATIPVATRAVVSLEFGISTVWTTCIYMILLCGISLLLIWRGRGRAAGAMMFWVISALFGNAFALVPGYGMLGLSYMLIGIIFYLLARIGFYLTVEYMLGDSLSALRRTLFRAIFLIVMTAGAIQQIGGSIAFVNKGWAELLQPGYGMIFTAGYLIPLLMLFLSYHLAEVAQHNRLRWLLWGGVIWLAGIFFSNTPVFNIEVSYFLSVFCQAVAMALFLYAILRHRVVSVSVIIDRTLVYGSVTALVVGILAAANSVVQHAALGTSASLLVEVAVPLSLGIVLSRVRFYMDLIVERVFFRTRYQVEKHLREFARRCGQIDNIQQLFKSASEELRDSTHSPGVAIYANTGTEYVCMQQAGELTYPERLDKNDPALVAVRADLAAVDVINMRSALRQDVCVFPMLVLGVERGVIVCANRPGEHFAADEKALLSNVANDVGAAWRILRARKNEEFIRSLAEEPIKAKSVKAQAQKLKLVWSGG